MPYKLANASYIFSHISHVISLICEFERTQKNAHSLWGNERSMKNCLLNIEGQLVESEEESWNEESRGVD